MAPTNDKASDLERRVSTRTSVRISLDAVEDDFDFAAGGVVADGFRPHRDSNANAPSSTSGSSTFLPDDRSASSSTPKPAPSSTTPKFQLVVNPSLSRDVSTPLSRQATGSTESTAYQGSDGPYRGPSVPSHPYQMYTQNVRSTRTLSTTTASTVPPSEGSYNGPRGPSHPYTLYPQTDGIEADAVQGPSIPLGFHGLPDQYRRRAGPDGDDVADIIGPDGHTEQLPPYTRYPDEAYARKAAAMDGPLVGSLSVAAGGATVVPAIRTTPTSAMPAIPGAGGIGLATRNPEFESTDDLATPQSRHSTRSFASDDSARQISFADGVATEKRPAPKKWQLWMRRKLCGVVPYWALCLAAIILLIMAVVLGAVIGVFLRQRKPPPRKDTW
jgi:hypothetical protein